MSFLQQAVSEYPSQKKPRTVFSCTGIPPSWPHQNHPKTGGAPSRSSYRRQHFSWSYVVCPRLDSYVVQTFGNCFTRLALDPTMAERPAPARGDKQVLKGQVKKCEERLGAVLEERMERVELRQELSEAYCRLRVEHCNALKTVWDDFEAKAFPPGELRQRAAKAVEDEVRQQLQQELPEETLQQKSKELSNDCRAVGTREARAALATRFQVTGLLEWVHKDKSGGYGLVLEQGEPSRLVYEQAKRESTGRSLSSAAFNPPRPESSYTQTKAPKPDKKVKEKGVKGKAVEEKGGKEKSKGVGVAIGPTKARLGKFPCFFRKQSRLVYIFHFLSPNVFCTHEFGR